MKELKINRGIELMLRRAKPKEQKSKKGLHINKVFSLFKRKVYFNFELRWDKETKTSSELNND